MTSRSSFNLGFAFFLRQRSALVKATIFQTSRPSTAISKLEHVRMDITGMSIHKMAEFPVVSASSLLLYHSTYLSLRRQ